MNFHEGDYLRFSIDSFSSDSDLSNCYLIHKVEMEVNDINNEWNTRYKLTTIDNYDDKIVIAREFNNVYFGVYATTNTPITIHIDGLQAQIITREKISSFNCNYGIGYNKPYNYKNFMRKKNRIEELLNDNNTICFTQLSDIHFDTGKLDAEQGYSQIRGAVLSSKMLSKLNAIIICGDYSTYDFTPEQVQQLSNNIKNIIDESNCTVLHAKGNHDTNMYSGSNEKLLGDVNFYNNFTSKNKYVNQTPNFDNGIYQKQNYYYVDDDNIKHRYIILNSFEGDTYFDYYKELLGTTEAPIDFYPIWEKLSDNNEKYYCILEGATYDGTSIYNFSRQLGYFQKSDNILYFYSYTDQNYNNYSVDTINKICSRKSYSNYTIELPFVENRRYDNQINWFLTKALDMTNKTDYTVSVHTHDSMASGLWNNRFANDYPEFRLALQSFKNGTSNSYGNYSWDFTSQGAIDLIGVFSGHLHENRYTIANDVNYYANNASNCKSESWYDNGYQKKQITPARCWLGESSMSQNIYIYNKLTKKMNVFILGVGNDIEFTNFTSPVENNIFNSLSENERFNSMMDDGGKNLFINDYLLCNINAYNSQGKGNIINVSGGDQIIFKARAEGTYDGTLNIVPNSGNQQYVHGIGNITNTYTVPSGVTQVCCGFASWGGKGTKFYDIGIKIIRNELEVNLFNFNGSNTTLVNNRCTSVVNSDTKITINNNGNRWSRVECTISGLDANTNYIISADITNESGNNCGFYTDSSNSMGTETSMSKSLTLSTDSSGNFYVEFYTNLSEIKDSNTIIFDNVKLVKA